MLFHFVFYFLSQLFFCSIALTTRQRSLVANVENFAAQLVGILMMGWVVNLRGERHWLASVRLWIGDRGERRGCSRWRARPEGLLSRPVALAREHSWFGWLVRWLNVFRMVDRKPRCLMHIQQHSQLLRHGGKELPLSHPLLQFPSLSTSIPRSIFLALCYQLRAPLSSTPFSTSISRQRE